MTNMLFVGSRLVVREEEFLRLTGFSFPADVRVDFLGKSGGKVEDLRYKLNDWMVGCNGRLQTYLPVDSMVYWCHDHKIHKPKAKRQD